MEITLKSIIQGMVLFSTFYVFTVAMIIAIGG